MLAAAEDTGITQPTEEFAGVGNDLLGIIRDCPRAHHGSRGLKRKVERGSEVHVEAERAAVRANDASVLTEERAVAGGKDLCRRWCGPEHVAETVYGSAFEVYTSEEVCRDVFLAVAQEATRLLGTCDVARKQDHAGWLDACEQRSETRIHLGAVEADDQELADLFAETVSCSHRL